MPKVPYSDNVVPFRTDPAFEPSKTDLLMAAGMMHNEGKLFEHPEPSPLIDVLKDQEKDMEAMQKHSDVYQDENMQKRPKAQDI